LVKNISPKFKIAFFTHNFLEPTHYAIEQVLSRLDEYQFHVFAKRFMDQQFFNIPNISKRTFYTNGKIPELKKEIFDFAHAIYDGKTAIRAGVQAKAANLPFILSFHGGFDTNAKIFDNRYTNKTKEVAIEADVITVIAKSDVRRLNDIGVNKKVEIIPVPIDFDLLPIQAERDKYSMITVGRFIPKKGIDIAIRALSLLPQKYYLKIIGFGEQEQYLLQLADSFNVRNRIQWLGGLPLIKMLDHLNKSGVLIQSSRVANDGNADGTPQVVLWSQALNVPVIATKTGSLSDIISNENTGLLIDSENPEKLALSVIELVEDKKLAFHITSYAKEQVLQNHSQKKIIERWKDIYNRLSINGSY
jgi:glycosyltransferase involved in cell wall biosynthesis